VYEMLTGPFAAAAVVLCIAGLAKLRSPLAAEHALIVLGARVPGWVVRGFGAVEVALGGWCLLTPRALAAACAACAYSAFAGVAMVLAARRAACGCFGIAGTPASSAQSLVSGSLAVVCAAAAMWTPHGFAWILRRPPGVAAAIAIGIAGCAYAIVLAYTQLPSAWAAWSPE
jgi:hypothetical protein